MERERDFEAEEPLDWIGRELAKGKRQSLWCLYKVRIRTEIRWVMRAVRDVSSVA